MFLQPSSFLISSPFGNESEKRETHRYHYKNDERGRENYVIIQYSREGEGIYRDSKGEHIIGPGKAFIVFVPEKSEYYYPRNGQKPWVFAWLNFYGEFSVQLWKSFCHQFGQIVEMDQQSNAALEFFNLIRKVNRRSYPSPFSLTEDIFGFCMKWWEQLSHRVMEPEKAIHYAVRFCKENYREPLTVKELSAMCGMSREHFTRLFTEMTSLSPATFLRNERLKAAQDFLDKTSLPISEVAMRCGFYSPRHFSRAYVRAFGKNPRRSNSQGMS